MSVSVCGRVCVFVGLSVLEHISGTTRPTITKFSKHVTRGRGLTLCWRYGNSRYPFVDCIHPLRTVAVSSLLMLM